MKENDLAAGRTASAHTIVVRSFFAAILWTAVLASTAIGQSTTYNGIEHTPLGGAVLNASGGTLTVSNIGSSGKDGVRADLGDSLNWFAEIPLPSSKDWSLRTETTSTVDGQTGIPTAGMIFNNSPGDLTAPSVAHLLPNFGNVPPNGVIIFEVYGKDGQTHRIPRRLQDSPEATWNVDSFFDIAYRLETDGYSDDGRGGRNKPACVTRVIFPPGECFPVTVGGRTIPAIGVGMAYLLSPFEPGTTSQNIIAILIGLSQPGSVDITDERFRNGANLDGVPILALGNVELHPDPAGGGLTVSNIGSSGLDGVSIELGEAQNGFDARLPGGQFQVDSFFDIWTEVSIDGGLIGGPPNQGIGHARLEAPDNNGVVLHADFSPIDVTQAVVEILDGTTSMGKFPASTGQPLGQLVGPGGGLPGTPTGFGTLERAESPLPAETFFDIDTGFVFIPQGGGQPVQGTRIYVCPDFGSKPVPDELKKNGVARSELRIKSAGPGTFDTEMLSMDLRGNVPGFPPVQFDVVPLPRFGSLYQVRYKLVGQNFPLDPRDICVVLPIEPGLHLPMQVIGVPSPDCIIVEEPPMPPGAVPGVPMILFGDGGTMHWDPLFPDLLAAWRADVFSGRGTGTPGAVPVPDRDDDALPENVTYHFGRVEGNSLVITLSGDWGPNVCVDMIGHMEVIFPSDPIPHHFDFQIPRNLFTGGGTLFDCAARIEDMFRCTLAQLLGIDRSLIDLQFQTDGTEVRMIIRFLDPVTNQPAQIGASGIAICVTEKKTPPVVENYILSTPGIITNGTLIKIFGQGFGNSESGLIIEMCTRPRSTIFEPILVRDNCIVAKVGSLPQNAVPGPIKIRCGDGQIQPWQPGFDDLRAESPAELVIAPPFPPLIFDPFNPLPPLVPPELILPPLPENVEYIDAEVVDGRFCMPLTSDWGPNVSISMLGVFELENPEFDPAIPGITPSIFGYVRTDRARLLGSGTRLECAARIKDTLRCAFDAIWEVKCVEDPASGDVTLYFWIPGFPILDGSTLTMCVFRPFAIPEIEAVRNLTPGDFRPGAILEICGGPFPLDPFGACIGMGPVPIQPIANIDGKLIGRVGLAPPGVLPGPPAVELARGRRGFFFPDPFFPLPPLLPLQVFVGDGVPPGVPGALPELPPFGGESDPLVTYFPSEPEPGPNGELCLILEGDWCPGSTIAFEGHLVKQGRPGEEPLSFDFFVPSLTLEEGGPVDECARMLKDIPACGLVQLQNVRHMLIWDCIPLGDTNGNGEDEVKITVRCPFYDPATGAGTINGHLLLCLSCPPEPLEIKSVTVPSGTTPVCVKECDIICIEVCHAGDDPKDLCAMIGNEPGNTTPLIVQEIIPLGGGVSKVIAQVGPVPPGAFPAPVFMTRGKGNCGIWQPGLPGLERPNRPGWVFESQGNPTAQSTTIVWPKPNFVPHPNEICFEGHTNEEMTAVCIDLVGSWQPGSLIKLSGHLGVFDPNGSVAAKDIHSPITRVIEGGTAEDCAGALKDIFRCQFDQLGTVSDIDFTCPDDGDNDPNTATVKIVPVLDGVKIRGEIKITLCTPPAEPVVTSVDANPNGVCPGDTVCIFGTGFSPNIDDYCVVVGDGLDAFRLRVVGMTPGGAAGDDDKLTCVVEVIPNTVQPGVPLPLYIGIASGKRVAIAPVIDGMVVGANPWTWQNPGGFPVLCIPDAIVPAPKPPPSDERWFHATLGQNGEMIIDIPAGIVWAPQQNISVDGHIILPPPFGDLDVHSRRVRLRNGGTPEQCAEAIKDILRCVFRQLEGFDLVRFKCDVSPQGAIRITLCWPEPTDPSGAPAFIRGFLTLCLLDPAPTPVLIGTPTLLETGQIVTITGRGFGEDPDDLCMVATFPDGRRVSLRVIQATDEELLAVPGLIPPGLGGPGRIGIMRGHGQLAQPGDIAFAFPQIDQLDPIWTWDGPNPDAGDIGPPDVDAIPTPDDPNQRWFRADLVDGKLCVVIRGDWQPDSVVRVTARAHNECQRLDLDGPSVRFLGSGSAAQCADMLKDLLVCAFIQQTGAVVDVSCDPIIGTNSVKITIKLENGKPIDWGLCDICVQPGTGSQGDTDGDGLSDDDEQNRFGTDPANPDTDGDGLLDGQELVLGTDLLNPDTDGDGCLDGEELVAGTNALDSSDCSRLLLSGGDPASGFTLLIPETNPGRSHTIRMSTNLIDWQPLPVALDLLPSQPGGPITIQLPPIPNGNQVFFDNSIRRP